MNAGQLLMLGTFLGIPMGAAATLTFFSWRKQDQESKWEIEVKHLREENLRLRTYMAKHVGCENGNHTR